MAQLSAPSSAIFYMDYTYTGTLKPSTGKTSRRGRKKLMKRFKIKYTNTKGIVKTRNIKATSEEKAMSEIKDMSQHHYTIVEDEGEGEGDPPRLGSELHQKIVDTWKKAGFFEEVSSSKIELLAKYAQQHLDYAITDSYTGSGKYYGSTDSWNYDASDWADFPVIRKVTPTLVNSGTLASDSGGSPEDKGSIK